MTTTRAGVIWMAIRPKTLPASLSPVILGTLMVPASEVELLLVVLALGCALSLQITVNLCNDFFDARNGIDSDLRLGPTRVTQAGLIPPGKMKTTIAIASLAALICGLTLALLSDYRLLFLGLACFAAAFAYSGGPVPLASHGMGEVAVLVFFGWVAVMGSYYVHTLQITLQIFLLANALGVILAAIMLVNNIRDIDTDYVAGKKTLAVHLGRHASQLLFCALLIACALLHVLAFSIPVPQWSLAFWPVLLYSLPALLIGRQLLHARGRAYNFVLGRTSMLCLWYSLVAGCAHLFSQFTPE